MKIPESHQDLLSDNLKAFVYLATIMKDGTPQVTPVWFSWNGVQILINSAQGRLKDRNMRQRPNVALVIQDPANPYRYLEIRGKVVDITTEGAVDHINFLSMKYKGNPNYKIAPGDLRVIYRIMPENVHAYG